MRMALLPCLLTFVFAAACSGVRAAPDSPDASGAPGAPSTPARPPTTLEVRNRKPIDVDVYVLDRTQRVRLGTVPGRRTRTFTIPPHLIAEGGGRLRFHAEALGSENLLGREDELLVREGEQLSVTLQ
jgi:hypothetical protein